MSCILALFVKHIQSCGTIEALSVWWKSHVMAQLMIPLVSPPTIALFQLHLVETDPVTIVIFSDEDEVIIFYDKAHFFLTKVYTSVNSLICLFVCLFIYYLFIFVIILMTKHLFPDQGFDECQPLWEKVRQCRADDCSHLFYQRSLFYQ